jgi:hypothetical protein
MKLILCIILMSSIFLQSCNISTNKSKNGNNDLLVGSWKFIADQELDSANRISKQDTSVSGLLIYTLDGKMSVQLLWRGTRSSMINDTIMNQDGKSYGLGSGSNTWTIEQSRKIIDTYDAYFGNYTIDWNKSIVIHTITGNLRPEKVGTSYKRAFQLKGDTLFLRSVDPAMKWQTAWLRNK